MVRRGDFFLCPGCNRDKKCFEKGLCQSCYNEQIRKIGTCCICNEEKKIKAKHMCVICYDREYEKNRKRELCECGEISKVKIRIDGKPICLKCYNKKYRPKEICFICKELKIVENHNGYGNPICYLCYTNKDICDDCGRIIDIYANYEGCRFCESCYEKIKRKNNFNNYKIKKNIQRRVREVLTLYTTTGKIYKSSQYGIDYEAIIEHLKPFPVNMENYHIDHIFPLSAFDLSNPIHIKAAFAPENHQWLLIYDNLVKFNKYNVDEFNEYIKKFM